MKSYEKPTIMNIVEMEAEQIFAKKSGSTDNNGRWGDGNQNSNNHGEGHGDWHGNEQGGHHGN